MTKFIQFSIEYIRLNIDQLKIIDAAIENYPIGKVLNDEVEQEENWKLENFIYKLPDKEKLSFFLEIDNTLVGFLIASSYCSRTKSHLSRLSIHSKFQNMGLGKTLLQKFEDESGKLGFSSITTTSKKGDLKAISFYQNQGFAIIEDQDSVIKFLNEKNKIEDKLLFSPFCKSNSLILFMKNLSIKR